MKLRHMQRYLDDFDPSDFWSSISQASDFKSLSWTELFDTVKYYLNNLDNGFYSDKKKLKSKIPKYIYDIKHFNILDEIGFDYDHIDGYGNSFIQFSLDNQRYRRGSDNHQAMMSFISIYDSIDLLMKKIKDKNIIYNINAYGENILFDLCSLPDTGLNCEKIIEFIEKYPNFNLNQCNKDNRNLLYEAISKHNYIYANYLLEKGLSFEVKYNAEIMNKGYKDNYLSVFATTNFNEDAWELFEKFSKKLDICPAEGDNIFKHHLDWATNNLPGLRKETQDSSRKWVLAIIELVINQEIYNRYENMERIVQALDSCKNTEFKNSIFPHLNSLFLEYKLKDNSDKKTQRKIKI